MRSYLGCSLQVVSGDCVIFHDRTDPISFDRPHRRRRAPCAGAALQPRRRGLPHASRSRRRRCALISTRTKRSHRRYCSRLYAPWHRRLPHSAHPARRSVLHPHLDADRARPARRHSRRPGSRCRRLPPQALRSLDPSGPHQDSAAPHSVAGRASRHPTRQLFVIPQRSGGFRFCLARA